MEGYKRGVEGADSAPYHGAAKKQHKKASARASRPNAGQMLPQAYLDGRPD